MTITEHNQKKSLDEQKQAAVFALTKLRNNYSLVKR